MANFSRSRHNQARVPATFDAFRNPGFRLLWPANFFSYVSRWMQMTLLAWLILELTDSPFYVALVGFFGMIPLLAFGAIGGVLADRMNRRNLLIATQALNLAAAIFMTLLLMSDSIQFWHGYIVVFVSGLGWAFDMPSRRSIVRDLIGGATITNAMALDSVGMHASRMTGPALAGGLIALIGVTGGYFAIIAFYVVSIIFMFMVRVPGQGKAVASVSVIRNLVEGFAYVRSHRVIFATVIITVLMNLLLFPYVQMVPVIAKDTLEVGPGLMGILLGADGLGAIIGSVSIASAGRLRHHGRVYLYGSLLGLTMALLFAASQWFGVSLVILMLLGLGTAGFGTMQSTIIVISASEEMRGRALGVISIAIGAGPVGALLIGIAAQFTSPSLAIAAFVTLGLISVGIVGILMSEIRGQMGQFADRPPSDTTQPTPQRA